MKFSFLDNTCHSFLTILTKITLKTPKIITCFTKYTLKKLSTIKSELYTKIEILYSFFEKYNN